MIKKKNPNNIYKITHGFAFRCDEFRIEISTIIAPVKFTVKYILYSLNSWLRSNKELYYHFFSCASTTTALLQCAHLFANVAATVVALLQ